VTLTDFTEENMNKKLWTAILGAAVCAGMLTGTASAATINQRQHREQARIRQGVRSGELTRQETKRLELEQRRIQLQEQLARRNGLTAKERLRLQMELDKANRDIYKQKHDNQDRG
jgi:hypothetical protein